MADKFGDPTIDSNSDEVDDELLRAAEDSLTAKGSIFSRLYRGETAFAFIPRMRRWFILSAVVIILGMGAVAIRGLNFGIDFKGGTAWQVPSQTLSVKTAQADVAALGVTQATVVSLGGSSGRTIQVEADLSKLSVPARTALEDRVSARLAKDGGVSAQSVGITDVGPTWGGEITSKAIRALIFFFLGIVLYISLRFEWKMAAAAVLAVIHDLLVTVGIYALVGFQVTPATVIAVLTILGYSLYDTIVVFDRVQENVKALANTGRMNYSDTVNLSVNQVLMRSLNTSIVAIIPILSILLIGAELLGATTLQDFGLALFVGLTTGAYSSIFIASPLLCIFKEREKRYQQLRLRISAKGAGAVLLTPRAAAMAGSVAMVSGSSSNGSSANTSTKGTGGSKSRAKKRR